jgi:FMN phosphatase YigB (HAD superfamily)
VRDIVSRTMRASVLSLRLLSEAPRTPVGRWRAHACATRHARPDAALFDIRRRRPRSLRTRYTGALEALGLAGRPGDAIFVDDSATNCAAAEALGLRAVHFDGDAPALRRALAAHLPRLAVAAEK